MLMLYNSENFAVVQFEFSSAPAAVATDVGAQGHGDAAIETDLPTGALDDAPPDRGGYEIVDKFARKEIFLEGALAQQFREGVEALIQNSPSEEEIDTYLGRFAAVMQQPVVLH